MPQYESRLGVQYTLHRNVWKPYHRSVVCSCNVASEKPHKQWFQCIHIQRIIYDPILLREIINRVLFWVPLGVYDRMLRLGCREAGSSVFRHRT